MSNFGHVQMGVGPRVDPGHAGDIMSLSWLVNASMSSEELEVVVGKI